MKGANKYSCKRCGVTFDANWREFCLRCGERKLQIKLMDIPKVEKTKLMIKEGFM